MHFNPALHGLRGLAAMLVLLYHWRTNFPAVGDAVSRVDLLGEHWNLMLLVDLGWVGVQWFFVLSGYLLGGVLWNKPLNVSTAVSFWQRRFMRIYPGLWLQLLLMSLLTPYTLLLKDLDPLQMLHNALLWIHPLPGGSKPYNGVWWTLPIELCLFLVGVALHHWRQQHPTTPLRLALWATTAFYLLWLYLLSLQPRSVDDAPWVAYLWEPVLGLLIASILYLVVQPAGPARWLGCRPLLLAMLSYYAVERPALNAVARWQSNRTFNP